MLRRRAAFVLALAATALAAGCRRRTPEAPPAAPAVPTLDVSRTAPHLYTFARPDGTFETTDKPDDVPAERRRIVRVVDPSAAKPADATSVYVVDVAELLRAGKATARAVPRELFETGALALLPPGRTSALADAPPPGERPPEGVDAGAASPGAARPVVIVYGASWCGACKAAREYLASKRIPFVDKDIEKDADAARELAGKAARAGVPSDRIPILDVRGRLLIGFDPARLEGLLGEVI